MHIAIQPIPGTVTVNVVLWEKIGDNISTYTVDKNGSLIANSHKAYEGVSYDEALFLQLNLNHLQEVTEAFMEYARTQGIDSDSESKAKGKLEIMERWNADLRTLLKLK